MELPFDPVILLLGIYPKNPKTPIQKNICTPVVHSHVIYNSQDLETAEGLISSEWIIKAVVDLHNGILGDCKNEGNLTYCDSMDEPGNYYAKRNKQPEKDKYHMVSLIWGI